VLPCEIISDVEIALADQCSEQSDSPSPDREVDSREAIETGRVLQTFFIGLDYVSARH
jgi:hypothetical protein